MLAKANRLASAGDFRATVRFGRKHSTVSVIVYTKRDSGSTQSRFGFIVSKAVGGAVVRNKVKRRLRAIASQALPQLPVGVDVVVRALPASGSADWNTLARDLNSVLAKI